MPKFSPKIRHTRCFFQIFSSTVYEEIVIRSSCEPLDAKYRGTSLFDRLLIAPEVSLRRKSGSREGAMMAIQSIDLMSCIVSVLIDNKARRCQQRCGWRYFPHDTADSFVVERIRSSRNSVIKDETSSTLAATFSGRTVTHLEEANPFDDDRQSNTAKLGISLNWRHAEMNQSKSISIKTGVHASLSSLLPSSSPANDFRQL